MRIVFAIWKKDLIDAVVNLRLLASIAMPVFMSVLFGALFGGLRSSDVPASLVSGPGPASVVPVYDAGESQIPQLLNTSESFDVRFVASPEEMKNALVDEHLNAGLILPEGFDAALTGFTVTNGNGTLEAGWRRGGGIYCRGASPTIEKNLVEGNNAHYGGGIACSSHSDPMIIDNEMDIRTSSLGLPRRLVDKVPAHTCRISDEQVPGVHD